MGYVGTITDTTGTKHLVGSTLYGVCSTAAATAAKVVTLSNFNYLADGVTVHVQFTYAPTAFTSLKVGSTDAKSVTGLGAIPAGGIRSFTYDGTNWVMNDDGPVEIGTQVSPDPQLQLYQSGVLQSAIDLVSGDAIIVNGEATDTISISADTTSSITAGTTSDKLPTAAAVANFVASQITGAAAYMGVVFAESDLLNVALKLGWYYVVAMPNPQTTSVTIGGKVCEAGDMIFVNTAGTYTTSSALGAAIDVVQNNIETLTTTEIDAIWTAA